MLALWIFGIIISAENFFTKTIVSHKFRKFIARTKIQILIT